MSETIGRKLGEKHLGGNENCPDCLTNFPIRCMCGGLIHAWTIDRGYVITHHTECDLCDAQQPVMEPKREDV